MEEYVIVVVVSHKKSGQKLQLNLNTEVKNETQFIIISCDTNMCFFMFIVLNKIRMFSSLFIKIIKPRDMEFTLYKLIYGHIVSSSTNR